MTMPKKEHQNDLIQTWGTYLDALENSLDTLEMEITETEQMAGGVCTDEWCEATQHYIDDIGNALFSIYEPRWSNETDSDRIKKLKRRLHALYADYRAVYQKVAWGSAA